MARIPQYFLDDLLARTDIVEVIGSRIQIKKQGREYVALSPFTNEKTPSFTISPQKQFFHCFSSGKHGNAIGFLMEHERLEFREAIEALAERVGLEIPEEAGPARKQDTSLYDTLAYATKQYRSCLANDQLAKTYVEGRGLDSATVKKFALGFSPSGWDFLTAKASTPERLVESGMAIKKDAGGYYDRFRQRLMFPIRDSRGRTIAFGGRTIADDNPKYLNSPETPLFHKGKQLYGLYEARQANAKLERILVVEGYMDVVSLAQFGVDWAVATLGTATTTEQVSLLFRHCPLAIFCFDGDRAGRDAAWRALERALPALRDGREIRFLFLPDGEDPDSLVRSEGQAGLMARIEQARPLSQYFFDVLSDGLSIQTPDGQARLIERTRPHMKAIAEGAFRSLLFAEMASRVRLSTDEIRRVIDGNAELPKQAVVSKPRRAAKSGNTLVRSAILCLLDQPKLATSVPEGLAIVDSGLPGAALLQRLIDTFAEDPDISLGNLLQRWGDDEDAGHLARFAALNPVPEEFDAEREFAGAIEKIGQHNALPREQQLAAKGLDALTPEERAELLELSQRPH